MTLRLDMSWQREQLHQIPDRLVTSTPPQAFSMFDDTRKCYQDEGSMMAHPDSAPRASPGRFQIDCQSCLSVQTGEKATYMEDCGRVQRSPYTPHTSHKKKGKFFTKVKKNMQSLFKVKKKTVCEKGGDDFSYEDNTSNLVCIVYLCSNTSINMFFRRDHREPVELKREHFVMAHIQVSTLHNMSQQENLKATK